VTISSPFWKNILKNTSFYASLLFLVLAHVEVSFYCLSKAKAPIDVFLSFAPFFSLAGVLCYLSSETSRLDHFWPHLLGVGFLSSNLDQASEDCYLLDFVEKHDPVFAKKNKKMFQKKYKLNSLDRARVQKRLEKINPHPDPSVVGTFLGNNLLLPAPNYPSKDDILRRNEIFFQSGSLAASIKAAREKHEIKTILKNTPTPAKKTRKM